VACANNLDTAVNSRTFNSQSFRSDFSVNGDPASKGTTENPLALAGADGLDALQALWEAAKLEWA
jgi:hypothetical protein